MTTGNLQVVGADEGNSATTFGDVLHAVCAELKLSQFQLATLTGYSEAAISRVATGSRSLSSKLATKLNEAIGGSADTWLLVYEQTKGEGSKLPVGHFRDFLLGSSNFDDLPGTRVRRMRKQDIIEIFGNSSGTMTFRGVEEDCEIFPFFEESVQSTSYDTRVGGYFHTDLEDAEKVEEALEDVLIPPGETRMIITRETITLPSWLQASLHPAWSIGRKGLFVAHGPIIDPGVFSGRLHVNVFNPTPKDIRILTDEPFITLQFEMQDS